MGHNMATMGQTCTHVPLGVPRVACRNKPQGVQRQAGGHIKKDPAVNNANAQMGYKVWWLQSQGRAHLSCAALLRCQTSWSWVFLFLAYAPVCRVQH